MTVKPQEILSDPHRPIEPLSLHGESQDWLHKALQKMIQIRAVEDTIAEMIEEKLVRCPCHLGTGQEAIAVGIAHAVNKQDKIYGTHRAHAHFLAVGGSVYGLIAEVLGKVTGCSKGLGGSMHLYDGANGFEGSVPIVAGTIPIAVGAALALKKQNTQNIAICFFGDGACEEGSLHESLNLAASLKLPILFVCENNLYSSHLDISQRQPNEHTARFATAHCIRSTSIDGNDLIDVKNTAHDLIEPMRAGAGPAFLEVFTYRWKGHVGPKEDIDVGVRRKLDDLEAWKKRCPIKRLAESLLETKLLTNEQLAAYTKIIQDEIAAAKTKAIQDEYPATHSLLNYVYAGDL